MGSIRVLGLMSGTSIDGVDAAIIEVDDGRVVGRHENHFEPYTDDERRAIRNNIRGWRHVDHAWEVRDVTLDAIHNGHNRALDAMRAKGANWELVGFHGHTLAHDPENRRTLQAGDPAALATDTPVIYDFRSNDVMAGGEGAPLIPIYHYALVQALGFDAPVAIYNIGGVGNVTYVDPSQAPDAMLAFDTGPGNALIDDMVLRHFGIPYDDGGLLARKGKPSEGWLASMMGHEFFSRKPPKSLDRNSFQKGVNAIMRHDPHDAIASLTEFTVRSLRAAESYFPKPIAHRLVAGGGRKNATIMAAISAQPIDDFALDGDFIEAEGFAYMAYLHTINAPISFPGTTGVRAALVGGRRHRP